MNFFISTNCLLKRLHKVTADAFQAVRIYFILSIGLFSVFTSLGQGFQPIATSGYNFDAIAETFPNAVTTTTAAMDLSNFVMFSQAFGTAAGIGNGILNSGTIVNGSNTYQLMPFDGNNALRLTPGVNNGTLVLQTPASFSQLSVLGFATEGNSNISVTVNYTDATTNTFGPFLLNDWFFAAGFAYSGHGRITREAGAPYNLGGIPGNPRMYPINFNIPCASQQKLVASVVINHNSGTNTFIMALSGVGSGTMTAPGNQSVCAGQLTTPVNFSGTAGTTYTWTNNNTGIGLSAGGSGNIPAFAAVNSGSSPVTATITVTPTFAGCAGTPQTFTITVTPGTTPTFASPGSFCSGSVIPPLPTTSQNGISGTWSPAINNTVTTTYTFTPTPGQCASSTQLTIAIGQDILPTFATVGPFCSGASIPALPTSSQNSITGTWSPVINNTATTTYTFTPTAGQCASSVQTTIVITPNVLPTFSAVGPFCQGATIPNLPTTSQNGISGTWSPAINNQSTTTYTFTPNGGQCASTAQLTVVINLLVTPTFAAPGSFCQGAVIPNLPTTSQNNINGTWTPNINNQQTTTYNFNPNAGQCANSTQLPIAVTPNVTPTFPTNMMYCEGAVIPPLPTVSNNGIDGTWAPPINNQSTTNYTFTPVSTACAVPVNSTIVVNSPSFSTTALSVCQNILPYAWNGLSISASGQYQAILQNALGCDSVATLILNVVPVPVHVINLELCENQLPFVWQGLTLSQSGSTTVNILSSLGCDSLVTLNLLVRPLPSVAFNAQSVQGCAPLEVTFFNNSSLATNCQWDLGNGTIINSCGSVSTFYQGVGCYDVRLTITDPFGCTNSLLQTGIICVEPKPHASFTVSPNPLPAHNPVAQFTNTSQGHSTQIWNFGNNQGGSSVEHPTHAYPDVLGNYVVTLVVANENGCLDSTSQWVVVENSVIYYVPNTFTPDGDLLMNPSNPYLPRVLISMCII